MSLTMVDGMEDWALSKHRPSLHFSQSPALHDTWNGRGVYQGPSQIWGAGPGEVWFARLWEMGGEGAWLSSWKDHSSAHGEIYFPVTEKTTK